MLYIVIKHGQTQLDQDPQDIFHSVEIFGDEGEAKARWDYRVIIDMRKHKNCGAVSLYEVKEYNRETGAFVLGKMLRHEAAKLQVIKRYNTEKAVKA